jgi:uncharacterized protein YcbK (DUF882 family)
MWKVVAQEVQRRASDFGTLYRLRATGVDFSEGDILPARRAIGAQALRRAYAARLVFAPVLVYLGFATGSTESAVANGDTRTISLSNSRTNESGSFTYMVNGSYDYSVLEKLNWFCRDWRLDEPTKMDPKLFDIVWEVYRESGSAQPVDVLSGYRSPQTNAMLRMRSRQVAEHSQHMLGKAMDAHFIDVPTSRIRDIGMRMQGGGVGFYPTGSTPWVHLDSGSVRYWPRISHDQMVRLFPDGKTVFVPADGVPLSGYEQARAEIEARGGAVIAGNTNGSKASFGILSWLFGGSAGGADDAEEGSASNVAALKAAPVRVASNADAINKAKNNLPKGATSLQPADAVAAANTQKSQPVAAPESKSADSAAPANPDAAGAEAFVAPLPPRKPADLYTSMLALAAAPLPPVRPAEFASPQPAQVAAAVPAQASEIARRNDLIAALLVRGKLPGVITRGVNGPIPSNALALADVAGPPEPPERPAILAKAAALNALLPLIVPARAPAAKIAQSQGPIDRNDNTVTGSIAMARTVAAVQSPANSGAVADKRFAALPLPPAPFGDLPVDAFRSAANAASDGSAEAALYEIGLRGPAN